MNCFGRDVELAALWREFQFDKNILMLAPRRIGKTVLLNELKDTAAKAGFSAVLIDVEGYTDEKAFFRDCCLSIQSELSTGSNLMNQFSRRLSSLVNGSDDLGADWKDLLARTNWEVFADQLLSSLNEQEDGKQWLLLIDELPIFVSALEQMQGAGAMSRFLHWLRAMRQKYKNIRWLYTGSVGLDAVARRGNVEGALNDLQTYTLPPFGKETAFEFMDFIATKRSATISVAAKQIVVERLGWLSPYYIERIIESACQRLSPQSTLIDNDEIAAAMNFLLELPQRTYWSSWREHLNKNFPEPERSDLYKVLETVALSNDGVSLSHILGSLNTTERTVSSSTSRDMVHTLCADGYLIEQSGKYKFRMSLLEEWWLKFIVA